MTIDIRTLATMFYVKPCVFLEHPDLNLIDCVAKLWFPLIPRVYLTAFRGTLFSLTTILKHPRQVWNHYSDTLPSMPQLSQHRHDTTPLNKRVSPIRPHANIIARAEPGRAGRHAHCAPGTPRCRCPARKPRRGPLSPAVSAEDPVVVETRECFFYQPVQSSCAMPTAYDSYTAEQRIGIFLVALRQLQRRQHKYVGITTYRPDTKSNANSNPNPYPSTKQHAIMNIHGQDVIRDWMSPTWRAIKYFYIRPNMVDKDNMRSSAHFVK